MTWKRIRFLTVIWALALVGWLGGSSIVVPQAVAAEDTAEPLEVTRLVTAVAWQADKAEEKLVGGDQH